MNTVFLRGLLFFAFAFFVAPALAVAQEQKAVDTISVLDGVYSLEQADHGQQVFQGTCAFCHTSGEFTGNRFRASWSGRPLSTLHLVISSSMPLDNPGSLTVEEYAAVVAYVLRLNNYPTGKKALPSDRDSLALIRIEAPPEGE